MRHPAHEYLGNKVVINPDLDKINGVFFPAARSIGLDFIHPLYGKDISPVSRSLARLHAISSGAPNPINPILEVRRNVDLTVITFIGLSEEMPTFRARLDEGAVQCIGSGFYDDRSLEFVGYAEKLRKAGFQIV
jgi:hypothetical protein